MKRLLAVVAVVGSLWLSSPAALAQEATPTPSSSAAATPTSGAATPTSAAEEPRTTQSRTVQQGSPPEEHNSQSYYQGSCGSGSAVRPSAFIATGNSQIAGVISSVQSILGEKSSCILEYTSQDGNVWFMYGKYRDLSDKERKVFMEKTLKAISESDLSTQYKSKLYNFVARQDGEVSATINRLSEDTSTDFYNALALLAPFSGPFSTFLGIVAIIIFAMMGVSVVFDLAFLTLPIIRVNDVTDGSLSARLISGDAREAVKEEDSTGHSAVLSWMRRRFVSLTLLSIALMYLITGSFFDMMGWLLGVLHVS